MYALSQERFRIFHPRFFSEVFIEKMFQNYVNDVARIDGRFYTLPNLFWGNSESVYVHDYDLMKRNLAYRLVGSDTYPEHYEAFTDYDFERVDDAFEMLEENEKVSYLSDFLDDVYKAYRLFRLTHVVVEPSFTEQDPTPFHVYGAKGGGFSCMV